MDDTYANRFDFVLITIGATCWFKSLKEYFAIISKCMKLGAHILIDEQHPFTNMLANEGEAEYVEEDPFHCAFSYFNHEWISNSGMGYLTGKDYQSKTFTDYTHPIMDFIQSMCENQIVVTGMKEFTDDLSGNFANVVNEGFPFSMIIEGRKEV